MPIGKKTKLDPKLGASGLRYPCLAERLKSNSRFICHDLMAAWGHELNGRPWKRQKGTTCSKEQRLALIRHTWMHNRRVSVFLDEGRKGLPAFAPTCVQNFIAGPRPILESIGVFGKLQGIFVHSEVYERKAQARKPDEVGMHMNKVVLVGVTQTFQQI